MFFVTSDTHFGHANIIKYCNRPFSNTHEMNERLIANWNDVVSPGDVIYHLGDFGFGLGVIRKIIPKLNGRIKFIWGNHDRDIQKAVKNGIWDISPDKFEILGHYHEMKYSGCHFCLFHYPISEWNRCHHGSIHLCGHSHGSNRMSNPKTTVVRKLDIGVDCWSFKPVSLDDVLEFVQNKPASSHH